ncbi:MAG: MmgE/PrpD family protein [SAR324 cluster bacterium]|nr:MmgE/PrpD family protein [SAR324 cluster bacterium]
MTENPLDALARHAARTSFADLPAEAVRAAKTFLLDSLGVAVAGSAAPWARQVLAGADRWGAGEESTVWVGGEKLPAVSAALVNAYFTHCLEFDCVHEGAVVHPMATVLPASLAAAERRGGVGGAEFLVALVVGVDIATTLGRAATGPIRFFRPATAGAFGATAAVCRLAGLDEEGLRNALGHVYGQISGTLQPHAEGSPLLAMQMGFNARAALCAAELARQGIPAPRDVLIGPYGYFPLFEAGQYDLMEALPRLGTEWQVTQLSHKPFPSGRLTHGAVDGIVQLMARHGFAADDVEAVTVRVPPLAWRLVGRPDVPDPAPSYARLCLPFVAATALIHGTVDVPHFAPRQLTDARVHELAGRVEVLAVPHADERAITPQHVTVRLRGGRSHEIELEHILGHPQAPLGLARHLDKFRRCWGYGPRPLDRGVGEALIERVERLEEIADVAELVTLMCA